MRFYICATYIGWFTHSLLLTVTGLSKQLAKIHNSSLNTTHSARNLDFIFDENLSFSDEISSVCIRPYLSSKTASTIATFIVHPQAYG